MSFESIISSYLGWCYSVNFIFANISIVKSDVFLLSSSYNTLTMLCVCVLKGLEHSRLAPISSRFKAQNFAYFAS